MRKLATLLTMSLLLSMTTFAQTRTVSGQIKNDKGESVPFATITELGTKNAVKADANGAFKIGVKEKSQLSISATGFNSRVFSINSNNPVLVITTKEEEMQEVVVTALGISKQPRQLGYSTAKVSGKDLTTAKAVNIQNGLTGKVSGLNIATVNNGVFADTRITLRGIRSLTGNNQPLLVIDGVPVGLGYLNRLNPNDVDDINILKGASAASLYGPDGVNGVIIVKTKRGTKNGTPVVTVSNTTQFEKVLFLPKFQKQFGQGSAIDENGIGVYDQIENQQYGDEFDGSERELGRPNDKGEQQKVPYSALIGEKEKYFATGITSQNDVSISAKDFYLSAQDVNIAGTLAGDKNRRTTFSFKAAKEYGKFNADFTLTYTKSQYDVASNGAYWEVFNTAQNVPLTKYKDWRNDTWASPNHYFNDYYTNPYFIKDRQRSRGTSNDLIASTTLTYKILPWLNATYRAGTTVSNSYSKNTSEAFTYSPYARTSGKYNTTNDIFASVSDGQSASSRITSEAFLTGQKDFGKFNVDGLVGQSYRETFSKSMGVSGSNLIIPTLYNLSNRTGEPGASESFSETKLMGVFGKVAFGYDNWAFLEVTGRNDWDSRLPKSGQSFFYPGASASLVLSDAIEAIKNSNLISYLKLRGSVSKSGNVNLGAYSLDPTYGVAGGFPYGSLPGFTASSSVNNPGIKPEFVNSKEVGFEVSILKNRISLEATAYTQENSNQILSIQISRSTGYSSSLVNAANFTNKGLEFDLKLTPLVSLGALKVNVKTNFTLQDSKVNSVYEGLNEVGIGNGNFAITGYPAFMFKLTDYKRDTEGHVIVDAKTGYPSQNPTPVMFGRTMPKYIFGVNPSFEYKSFTLTVTADYRAGHQVYHGIGPDMDFTGISARSGENGRMRFIMPNSVYDDGTGKYVPNTSVLVRAGGYGFYEATATNRGINSNYITSAAAWKIREIALTYDVPAAAMRKAKFVKGVSLGLVARNVFTFLPSSNQWTDPEFSNTTGNALGINSSSILPPNRLYGFNISTRF
jgi:TonB-linked SusC/RagA family outer membrane protein